MQRLAAVTMKKLMILEPDTTIMVGHSGGWYEILVHYWLAIAYLGGVSV